MFPLHVFVFSSTDHFLPRLTDCHHQSSHPQNCCSLIPGPTSEVALWRSTVPDFWQTPNRSFVWQHTYQQSSINSDLCITAATLFWWLCCNQCTLTALYTFICVFHGRMLFVLRSNVQTYCERFSLSRSLLFGYKQCDSHEVKCLWWCYVIVLNICFCSLLEWLSQVQMN